MADLVPIPSSFEALQELEPQIMETKQVFNGQVLSRRVKSKLLTFCTLQVESLGQVDLCFAATLMDESKVPSPKRRNDLPVGLEIQVEALSAPRVRPEFLVRCWRPAPESEPVESEPTLSLPVHLAKKDQVNRRAKEQLAGNTRGIALCKRWSGCAAGTCNEASCSFRHYFEGPEEEAKAMKGREARERSQRLQEDEQAEYGEGPHDKAGKTHRAQRFAAWLLKIYGEEVLSSGRGVLDVAGGQGDLSWQLSVEYGIPCTLIDPALRRGGALKSWQRRALRKRGREEAFEHFPVSFEEKTFRSGSNQEVLRSASVVVGLHPDEATEAIVDVALAEKRRFAVVPCCVFAERFNHRELSPGVPVRTLNQFRAYLRAKDPRIQEDMLDFEGRNKVLYIP